MQNAGKRSSYRVYILRYWQEANSVPGATAVWRFSLEDPQTRQRRGFADLAALVSFLEAEMEAAPRQDPRPERPADRQASA